MRTGAITCGQRQRRCRYESIQAVISSVRPLHRCADDRALLLHHYVVYCSGGHASAGAGLRVHCTFVLRASVAAEKLDLAAGHSSVAGRRHILSEGRCLGKLFHASLRDQHSICGRVSQPASPLFDCRTGGRRRSAHFAAAEHTVCTPMQLDSPARRESCLSARCSAAAAGAVSCHFADAARGVGHSACGGRSGAASSVAAAAAAADAGREPAGAAAGRPAGAADWAARTRVPVRRLRARRLV